MFCDGKLDTTSVAIMPYDRLETDRIEALRYRAEDVFRTVGRHAVREARIRELRGELLNSERLAAHFEDNPEDLNLLRHDGSLARLSSSQHLRHLPAYLRHGSTGKQASCKEGVFGKIRSCLNEKNGVPLADLEEPSEFWQRKRKRRDGKMNNPRERMDALRSNGPSQAKNIFKNRRKKKGQHRSTN
jgi:ATP-dependent RNA helicase DDX56/DBP9